MGIRDKEFDITRSLKIVEKLKSQLLCDVANLFLRWLNLMKILMKKEEIY